VDEVIRRKILGLLDQHRIMTVATLRPDGWPQARDNRVSLTIDHDTPQVMEIAGLSMAARAEAVVDAMEGEKAMRMLMEKYPRQNALPLPMPKFADVRIFRLTPTLISVLDYSRGFGHTDLVTC